jgi:hypothetical protein
MKNIIVSFTLLAFSAIFSLFLSCSSNPIETSSTSSSLNVTSSLPWVFQGVTNAGIGNPDAEIITDTTLPEGLSQIMVYRIEKIGDSEASAVAKRFGIENSPVPFNPSSPNAVRVVYSYTDGNKTLEVYPIGRFIFRDSQRSMTSPITLPTEKECIDIATNYLQSKGIYPENVVRIITGVSSTVSQANTTTGEISAAQPTSFTIRFISTTNGVERYSSSTSVTLGDQGKIIQLTVNNPKTIEYGIVSLKSPETALNILKAYLTSTSFNPPEAKECTVNWNGFFKLVIKKVSLQYFSTDYNDYLHPIYVFEGEVQESVDRPNVERFEGRVDAVDH